MSIALTSFVRWAAPSTRSISSRAAVAKSVSTLALAGQWRSPKPEALAGRILYERRQARPEEPYVVRDCRGAIWCGVEAEETGGEVSSRSFFMFASSRPVCAVTVPVGVLMC